MTEREKNPAPQPDKQSGTRPGQGQNPDKGNRPGQKDQGAEKTVKPAATPEEQVEDEKRRKAG